MIPNLTSRLDLEAGIIEGAPVMRRCLADLVGLFADRAAYDQACAQSNPLVYTISTVEVAMGEGQLHYGLGVLMPGKVGREYYFTRGHLHAWRAAAEVYVGLRGQGLMLLEDEHECRVLPLQPQSIVYVPGNTAHRTINTGPEPLIYLGVYPADAGHDYATIAERNFLKVVVEEDGRPVLRDRREVQ
jgi:glucose-6-phosphate isomerase